MFRPDRPVGDLPPQSARAATKSPFALSPAVTSLSLVALSCGALFLFARPNGAQDLPAKKGAATVHKRVAVAKTSVTDGATAAGTEDRHDLSFYTSNVHNGMFSAPVPPAPKAVTPPVVVVKKDPPQKPIILPAINPFADWSYTGTVHIGDNTIALIENKLTGEGQYVKVGDQIPNMGKAVVKSVDDRMVTIITEGNATKPAMLAKADTIVVTPLNFDAPGKNPQQQQQAQNGQQQNGQQTQSDVAPNQPTVLGRNGQPITDPNQAARYQNRLNRGFGGGNNGGGNNGGGGRRGGRGGNGGGNFGG